MTLHQLRIFECVARHLNITKASAALHISQPWVSQQLKLLEEEFGTGFLVRLKQGVELTPEGRELFDAIQAILAEAEKLERRFKNDPKGNDFVPLIVGGSHNVSVNVLPKLMALKERHPSVQFILETDHSPAIEKRLLESELEIALITNPSHRAEIVCEPYEDMELVAFCPPTHPLARKKLTLKELVQCPLVLRGGGRLEKVFTSLGYKMNVALRCEARATVEAAVRIGMGVGILYRNAIASRVASRNLTLLNVPELKQMGIQSFIIFDRRKPLAPMAQEFLQILREKRIPPIATDEKRVQIGGARTLSVH
jgi:LysR family transcriptional regulator, low CO2-responsive transcriptional regulator